MLLPDLREWNAWRHVPTQKYRKNRLGRSENGRRSMGTSWSVGTASSPASGGTARAGCDGRSGEVHYRARDKSVPGQPRGTGNTATNVSEVSNHGESVASLR